MRATPRRRHGAGAAHLRYFCSRCSASEERTYSPMYSTTKSWRKHGPRLSLPLFSLPSLPPCPPLPVSSVSAPVRLSPAEGVLPSRHAPPNPLRPTSASMCSAA